MSTREHQPTEQPQQDLLREAMATLDMTRAQFAERIGISKPALDKWLLQSNSPEFREMPNIARKYIAEILAWHGKKPR